MTTLALPPFHLARLFRRLDGADASNEGLRRALEFWRGKRAQRLMPTAADLMLGPDSIAAHVFIFHRPSKTAEWELIKAGSDAATVLGRDAADPRLSKLRAPRIAARLRRLFEFVADTAEPMAGAFEFRVEQGPRQWIEVLAAPLSSNGRDVDGIFGGVTSRAEAIAPAAH